MASPAAGDNAAPKDDAGYNLRQMQAGSFGGLTPTSLTGRSLSLFSTVFSGVDQHWYQIPREVRDIMRFSTATVSIGATFRGLTPRTLWWRGVAGVVNCNGSSNKYDIAENLLLLDNASARCACSGVNPYPPIGDLNAGLRHDNGSNRLRNGFK